MSDIVFHPASQKIFSRFIYSPSHALILAGPEGIGKYSASRWIAQRLLPAKSDDSLQKYQYFTVIEPDGQSVSIEAIRELNRFTKLKIAQPNSKIARLAIVDHADLMSIEAQNALLKLLEEPPADTVLILNTTSSLALLPTIRSRAQIIQIQTPQFDDLSQYFSDMGHQQTAIKQAYLMSGGMPGLMHSLLEEHEDHPLTKASQTARQLLQADSFIKLAMVDPLAKQKQDASRTVTMVKQMAHAAISQNSTKHNAKAIRKWHKILRSAYDAESSLRSNAQTKLVLLNFVLQI